jgi:hypothetical protein
MDATTVGVLLVIFVATLIRSAFLRYVHEGLICIGMVLLVQSI